MKEYFKIPNKCPFCGSDTYIKDDFLYCSNKDCDMKLINHLDHFCCKKGLDIKGLSKQTLEKLINLGWINKIRDIFTLDLHREDWINQPGFGVKSVDNILSTIQDKRECELWQFISALSIPLIGSTYAKEIARRCETWENFRNTKDFLMWDGFGSETYNSLMNYNYEEADELVNSILHIKNSLYNNNEINSTNNNLNGKILCITGSLNHFKNRDEAIAAIEAAGGKVTSSVSKKTNYLVNNDLESTSSKNVKAKSLNIPIITEEQLLELL